MTEKKRLGVRVIISPDRKWKEKRVKSLERKLQKMEVEKVMHDG